MSTIKARAIKYHLFIEDYEIPAQSIQIQNTSGRGCNMTASIPPHPLCYKLLRGMKVWVYKQVNNEPAVLRFRGILMNKVYTKSYASRELRIECVSPDGRLNSLKVAELNKGNISSTGAIDYKFIKLAHITSSKKSLKEVLEENFCKDYGMSRDNLDKYYNYIEQLRNNSEKLAYDDFKEALKFVGDSLYESGNNGLLKKGNASEANETLKKDFRVNSAFRKLKDRYGVGGLSDNTEDGRIMSSIRDLYNIMQIEDAYITNADWQRNNELSIKMILNGLSVSSSNMAFGLSVFKKEDKEGVFQSNVKMCPGKEGAATADMPLDSMETMTEQSIASIYMRAVDAAKGNYIEAIKKIIEESFHNLPGLIANEWEDFYWEKALYSLPIVDPDYFSKELSQNAITGNRVLLKPLSKMLKQIVNDIIVNNPAGVPIYTIVSQILDTLIYKISINHTTVSKSIIMHPQMSSYFPPTQNVIFPNMYSSVMYNGNDWANPTRTYMVFQPYMSTTQYNSFLSPSDAGVSSVCIAPTEDPNIRLMGAAFVRAFNSKNLAKLIKENSNDKGKLVKTIDEIINSDEWKAAVKISSDAWEAMQKTQTLEEQLCGVYTNIVNFPQGYNLQESVAGQLPMADWLHAIAKYSTRSCSIMGSDELDNLIVGMPAIVVDGVYSVYGVVEDLLIMVDASGAIQTQVTLATPRMLLNNEFDGIAEGGLWLGCKEGKAENIGAVYADMLGGDACSIYDKCKQKISGNGWTVPAVSPNYSPTANMRLCIAHAFNEYIAASDKEAFVKEFRNVQEYTSTVLPGAPLHSSVQKNRRIKEYVEAVTSTDITYSVPLPDDVNAGAYSSFINIDLDDSKTYYKTWEDPEIYRRIEEYDNLCKKLENGEITYRESANLYRTCVNYNLPITDEMRKKAASIADGYNGEQATPTQRLELAEAWRNGGKDAKLDNAKIATPEELETMMRGDAARVMELQQENTKLESENKALEEDIYRLDKEIIDGETVGYDEAGSPIKSFRHIKEKQQKIEELKENIESNKEKISSNKDTVNHLKEKNAAIKESFEKLKYEAEKDVEEGKKKVSELVEKEKVLADIREKFRTRLGEINKLPNGNEISRISFDQLKYSYKTIDSAGNTIYDPNFESKNKILNAILDEAKKSNDWLTPNAPPLIDATLLALVEMTKRTKEEKSDQLYNLAQNSKAVLDYQDSLQEKYLLYNEDSLTKAKKAIERVNEPVDIDGNPTGETIDRLVQTRLNPIGREGYMKGVVLTEEFQLSAADKKVSMLEKERSEILHNRYDTWRETEAGKENKTSYEAWEKTAKYNDDIIRLDADIAKYRSMAAAEKKKEQKK